MITLNPAKYISQINALNEQLDESNDTIERLREEMASYKQTIAAFPGVKEEYDNQVRKLELKYSSKVKSLEAELAKEKESVNARVNIELASIGIPVKDAPKDEQPISDTGVNPEEILNKLNNLRGSDRTEFYRANESKITQAIAKLSKLNNQSV